MNNRHDWKGTERPRYEYVPHSWGYSRCLKCEAIRFFHESGPKGGTYVTYTWPRGHKPTMPGVPRRYITHPVGGQTPPCIHLKTTPHAA